MADTRSDRERFELELPFFVNGTLDDAQRAWMEARLAEHPSWQADVELARLTREVVRQARSTVPADERWQRLRSRLTDDGVLQRPGKPQPATARPSKGGKVGFVAALVRPLAVPWPVLGLALAVLAVQAYLLAGRGLGNGAEAPAMRYRAASAPSLSCADIAWLRVAVSPAMPVGEWAEALRTLGLTVAAGPADGGEWVVRLPTGSDPAAVRQALQAVPGIEEVQPATAPAGSACP